MSVRTIVEINHDYIEELRDNPHLIVEALEFIMFNGPVRLREKNELTRGVRFLCQRHHSEAIWVKAE